MRPGSIPPTPGLVGKTVAVKLWHTHGGTHPADQRERQRYDAGFAALFEQQLPFVSRLAAVDVVSSPWLLIRVRPVRPVPLVQIVGGPGFGCRTRGHRDDGRDRPQGGRRQDDGQQGGQQDERGRGGRGDERRGLGRRLAVVVRVGRAVGHGGGLFIGVSSSRGRRLDAGVAALQTEAAPCAVHRRRSVRTHTKSYQTSDVSRICFGGVG